MLKLALKAQLPIVAVNTRDTLNLAEVIKEISKKQMVQFLPNSVFGKNAVYAYVYQPETKFNLPLAFLYEKMTEVESTLLIVNPPSVYEPMFDAGEVPVPRPLMLKFLKAVVSDDKKAEALLRGLGGCTIKEAAELCRLTMARDASLTARGLMETRKGSFQGSKGLTQVDSKQGFYSPPEALQAWIKRERSFFLTGDDPRLRPRGLLFDGDPGTGKTAGSKWIAEQLGVPLYRFDVGGAKGKYVGTSEGNMLANLARLDNAEPCVVLIDEIEKIFSVKGGDLDGGTTTTMLSQLLWWLAEHKSRVLTIMTTNNAKALPPELHRKGRIDESMVFEGLTGADAASFILGVMNTFFKTANAAKCADELMGELFPKNVIPLGGAHTGKRYSQAHLTKLAYEFVKNKSLQLTAPIVV